MQTTCVSGELRCIDIELVMSKLGVQSSHDDDEDDDDHGHDHKRRRRRRQPQQSDQATPDIDSTVCTFRLADIIPPDITFPGSEPPVVSFTGKGVLKAKFQDWRT